MKTHSGIAKVHEGYQSIYAGYTLPITSIYIDYKDGMGVGVFADGSREYRLSLLETEFPKTHKYTDACIHDSHLDIIELNETICLPFDKDEVNRLIAFIQKDANRTLEDFIKHNTHPSRLPTPDVSTLYSDDEWENKTNK